MKQVDLLKVVDDLFGIKEEEDMELPHKITVRVAHEGAFEFLLNNYDLKCLGNLLEAGGQDVTKLRKASIPKVKSNCVTCVACKFWRAAFENREKAIDGRCVEDSPQEGGNWPITLPTDFCGQGEFFDGTEH